MDTLTLKSIQLDGDHGLYESERARGNRFELDVILYGDFRPAGEADDLSLTLDYQIIEKTASEIMSGPSQLLIESLCQKIGDLLFKRAPVILSMELALRKLDPPLDKPTAYAEIRMRWQR